MSKVVMLLLLIVSIEVFAQGTMTPPRQIEQQCGQYRVAITCGKELNDSGYADDNRQCNRNTLSFTGPDGNVLVPKQPNSFRQEFIVEKTPTSFACAQGKDGNYYVTVEFSACPAGAAGAMCMVHDLFTSDGRRLTVNSRNLDTLHKKYGIPFAKHLEIEEEK